MSGYMTGYRKTCRNDYSTRIVRALLGGVALLALGLAGCFNSSPAKLYDTAVSSIPVIGKDSALEITAVRSIKTVRVNRIAVMPIIEHPNATNEPIEEGAAEALTADAYSQATLVSGWDVVPDDDVQQAMEQLPPTTLQNEAANAIKLGHAVNADGVIYGTVTRYKERVGSDYAAQSPAAVAFAMHMVDLKTGVVVWTARFAKQQEALSQNIFNIVSFVQNRARWVRAHDIAVQGVQEAIIDLHSRLNLNPMIQPIPEPSGTGNF